MENEMCSPDAGCKIPALNRYSKLLSTTRSLFSRPTKKLTFLKANRWPFGPKHADGSPAEYSVQIIKTLEERVDVIIPGEVIEWTVLAYVRDAVQQGRNKAMIHLGHMNWEELGMKYAQEWISGLVDNKRPVTYVPSEDMYHYIVK